MGTPEFAVPSLKMLVEEGYDVAAVVTQPDRPKGRGNKLAAPPVKEYAVEKRIAFLQPEKVKAPEFADNLAQIAPDLLVTVAYGQILSKRILDIPGMGCINVHGSLLPKYRGAAPIQWAIINGESMTGITTMYTDAGMDTGDMLLKREVEITQDMTFADLHDRLSIAGAELLKETLVQLRKGTLERVPQPDEEATYAPMIKKEIGKIDWSKGAKDIHNLVRGTDPWPGAYTFYKGERMRVWKTVVEDGRTDKAPGTIIKAGKEGITASTGDGTVKIVEVQFDSCKRMHVGEYIRGHAIDEGEILG